ncbi:MAG: Mut7-C RNAse domain-containing protein, partial [Thermoplasmata archaeon]|nr:Mut7-C RNAse domain-containing protein [Thermoplasmata archaeon]
GYNTAYPSALRDDELLELAEAEGRVLLTRDKDLAARIGPQGLYVVSDDLDTQVRQVLMELRPAAGDPMSRCSVCNGALAETSREAVRTDVPSGVWERHERFWQCVSCAKLYWRGTHWEQMAPKIEGYLGLLGAGDADPGSKP